MVILKQYIGKFEGSHGATHYYMIQNDSHYGIELVQEDEQNLISTLEWFTENKGNALDCAKLLCKHGASPTHLGEIIDNYVL